MCGNDRKKPRVTELALCWGRDRGNPFIARETIGNSPKTAWTNVKENVRNVEEKKKKKKRTRKEKGGGFLWNVCERATGNRLAKYKSCHWNYCPASRGFSFWQLITSVVLSVLFVHLSPFSLSLSLSPHVNYIWRYCPVRPIHQTFLSFEPVLLHTRSKRTTPFSSFNHTAAINGVFTSFCFFFSFRFLFIFLRFSSTSADACRLFFNLASRSRKSRSLEHGLTRLTSFRLIDLSTYRFKHILINSKACSTDKGLVRNFRPGIVYRSQFSGDTFQPVKGYRWDIPKLSFFFFFNADVRRELI